MKRRHVGAMVFFMLMASVAIFFVHDTPDERHPRAYDPTAPTTEKFLLLAPWLSADAELVAVVDLSRAVALPNFVSLVQTIHWGKLPLLDPDLMKETSADMVAVEISLHGETSDFLLILQGTFDDQKIAAAMTSATTDDEMFACARLDSHHLAVGLRPTVERRLAAGPTSATYSWATSTPFFGRVHFSDQLKRSWPPQLAALTGADLVSFDGNTLRAVIPVAAPVAAQNLGLFLAGMKALLMLEQEGDARITAALDGITITTEDGTVRLEAPLDTLRALGKLHR